MNVHRAEWIGMLTIVCVLLGGLLALTLNTQRAVASRFQYITNSQELTQEWSLMQKKLLRLQDEVGSLRAQHEGSAEWQRLTMLSGLAAVTGPGVVVTLADSPQATNQKSSASNLPPDSGFNQISAGIIHDVDVLRVVNELFASGAEAVSVDKQRIGPGSSIRCVGPVINVNQVRCAAPFKIQAIGDPAALQSAMNLPGGVVAELKGVGCVVNIEQSRSLSLPAFDGAIDFKLAHLVQPPAKDKDEVQP